MNFIKLFWIKKCLDCIMTHVCFKKGNFNLVRSQSWMLWGVWTHFYSDFCLIGVIFRIPFRVNLIQRCIELEPENTKKVDLSKWSVKLSKKSKGNDEINPAKSKAIEVRVNIQRK